MLASGPSSQRQRRWGSGSSRRSCLMYRLAVTLGRRQRRLEPALEWASAALAEAHRPDLPQAQAAHLEGWARNIRAYVLMRAQHLEEAAVDCHAAFEALDAVMEQHPRAASDPDQLIREVAFTHSLLADNLAALASLKGDTAELQRWKLRADHLAEDFPELERFEALTWIRLYRELQRPAAALGKALSGARSAAAANDVLRWYNYVVQAADLHYRLGQAAEACERFEQAEELRQRLGDPPFLRPVALSYAAAAARAGRVEEAQQRLATALAAQKEDALDARSQLLAALGQVAAAAGNTTAAEEHVNQAIALAVESGERDTLLTTALAAARASDLLRRPDDAAAAYRQALEIAETQVEAATAPAPPAALLATLLGLAEHAADPGELPVLASRCLALLPAALEDADTWWDLRQLLGLVHTAAVADSAWLQACEESELEGLLGAAEQRPDCAPQASELRQLLSA